MAEKKINDATLLQLIPGWKQPGRGSAPAGSRSAAVSRRLKALYIGVTRLGMA